MWPMNNREIEEWAKRLELLDTGDPTLELARKLQMFQPLMPPAGPFKATLRQQLFARPQPRWRQLPALRRRAATVLATLLLTVIVLFIWTALAPRDGAPAAELIEPDRPVEVAPIPAGVTVITENGTLQTPVAAVPDFTLTEARSGDAVSLGALAGRPILLKFWATWCIPCRTEFPLIEAAYQQHREEGFVVLAVDFDEPPERVIAYGEELGLTFPLLLDPGGRMQKELYNIYSYPTHLFIGRDGQIAITHVGPLNEGDLARYLAQILAS